MVKVVKGSLAPDFNTVENDCRLCWRFESPKIMAFLDLESKIPCPI